MSSEARCREPNGVHCPIRARLIILDEFKNRGAAKSLERPRAGRVIAILHVEKLPPEGSSDDRRQTPQISNARADKVNRFALAVRHR